MKDSAKYVKIVEWSEEDHYPGRGCEGTLEGVARDAIAQMRQRVREEGAPEEVGQVVAPSHDDLL